MTNSGKLGNAEGVQSDFRKALLCDKQVSLRQHRVLTINTQVDPLLTHTTNAPGAAQSCHLLKCFCWPDCEMTMSVGENVPLLRKSLVIREAALEC